VVLAPGNVGTTLPNGDLLITVWPVRRRRTSRRAAPC